MIHTIHRIEFDLLMYAASNLLTCPCIDLRSLITLSFSAFVPTKDFGEEMF